MRIAAFTFAATLAATASAQDSFETRSDCLAMLQRALFSAQLSEAAPRIAERRLEATPDAASSHVKAALDAVRRRAQADADYADALMLICQSYD